jgi:hypothetical protein
LYLQLITKKTWKKTTDSFGEQGHTATSKASAPHIEEKAREQEAINSKASTSNKENNTLVARVNYVLSFQQRWVILSKNNLLLKKNVILLTGPCQPKAELLRNKEEFFFSKFYNEISKWYLLGANMTVIPEN